ncbi:hypothetical protein ACWGI9_44685 [Streptomyces sp. NPDC054833]
MLPRAAQPPHLQWATDRTVAFCVMAGALDPRGVLLPALRYHPYWTDFTTRRAFWGVYAGCFRRCCPC